MREVLESTIDVVVPAPKQQVPEEVAAAAGDSATLLAPELVVETEAAMALETMATQLSSEPGPSNSLAMVPQGGADPEAGTDTSAARRIHLEEIQLINNPLVHPDNVAAIMELHCQLGVYAEVGIMCLDLYVVLVY